MKLILKQGKEFTGKSFGAKGNVSGEVVFTTGMVGYVETLSDPSYAGQIVVFTYPLIGNYGVPERRFFESSGVKAAGVVVGEYSEEYSHHDAKMSLGNWLKKAGVPAISGVDTRELAKILRIDGVMQGMLSDSKTTQKFIGAKEENFVAKVSVTKKEIYGSGLVRILLIDCGVKENILRFIMRPETTVIRVPWNYDFSEEEYDGILISNGPGDPLKCKATIKNIRKAFTDQKPILGICLGVQLLAIAAGAETYKLKFGHRSQNQPCLDIVGKKRCYITSQNHGYAVKESSLPKDWKVWFKNANDGSVEGIKHSKMPWRAVQFHPEAAPGPTDTSWIFEDFITDLKNLPAKNL